MKEFAAFYTRLFTFYGIQLRGQTQSRNKFGWGIFRLISFIFILLELAALYIACRELYGSYADVGKAKANNEPPVFNFDHLTCVVILYFALSLLTHIYVWSATNCVDMSDAVEFVRKNTNLASTSKLSKRVERGMKLNQIMGGLNLIAVGLAFTCIFILTIVTESEDWNSIVMALFVTYAVTLGFFQAHCCLFFSLTMQLLTHSLAPPPTLNDTKLSSEFMLNYERVRELARKVNVIFSPVLALTCAAYILGVALLLSFPYFCFYLIMAMLFPSILPNFILCLTCLKSVVKCNRKRLQLIRAMSKSFIEVKKQPLKLIKRTLDFNCWLINVVLTDDDWFNLACYVPMDETVFLMVFQTLFDMYIALSFNYKYAATSKSILDLLFPSNSLNSRYQ